MGEPEEAGIRRFKPGEGDAVVLNFRIKSSTEASEANDPIEVQQTNLPLDDFEKHIRDRMAKSGWHNVRREWKELFDKADPADAG